MPYLTGLSRDHIKMSYSAGNILAVVKPFFIDYLVIIIVDIVLNSEANMKKSTSLF